MADGTYTAAIAGEIRAEMARQRRTGAQLAKVIRRTPNTTNSKIQGRTAFTLDELAIAADWLGLPMGRLTESARAALLVATTNRPATREGE